MVSPPASVTLEPAGGSALRDDQDFWRLYEASFPASERDPASVVLATAEPARGFVLRARANGRTVGFSVAHLLESAATTFLVYLAVDPDWRSKQVGRALFEATDRTGAKRFQAVRRRAAGMVWEIDDPTESDEPGERAIRLRRRTFFEMLGGRVLATLYIQPPIDGRTEVPMQLMFRPATACALPAAADRFALVRAIYFEKYQPMNQISASTLDRLLASVVGCGADME